MFKGKQARRAILTARTNSKAVTFGALGKQLYLSGKPYWFVPAALGIGLVLPIPFWLMHKKYPKQTIWRYLNVPIITNYMGWLPYSVNGEWRICAGADSKACGGLEQ